MKKTATTLVILAILLMITSIAWASPNPPKKFRIKGDTTYMEFHLSDYPPYTVLKSEGISIRNLHGTFSMMEYAYPISLDPPAFLNVGTLEIMTKKGDDLLISFEGGGDLERVAGTFVVLPASSAFAGLTGTFEGTADECAFPCDPINDPTCVEVTEPDCEGFYVDFCFD